MDDKSKMNLISDLVAAISPPELTEKEINVHFRKFVKAFYGEIVLKKTHEAVNESERILEPAIVYIVKELESLTKSIITIKRFGDYLRGGLAKLLTEFLDKNQPFEEKLTRVELHFSSTLLEIKNIPIDHTETKDNLIKLVLSIATKLEVDIQQTDIKNIFLAKTKEHPDRSIIVDFYTVLLKEDFMLQYKNYGKKRLTTRSLNISGPCARIQILENPSALQRPKKKHAKRPYLTARDIELQYLELGLELGLELDKD